MEKSNPVVIYRCRRCSIEFERDGIYTGNCVVNGVDVPVGSVNVYHLYNDGIYGLGDLIGAHEVKNEH